MYSADVVEANACDETCLKGSLVAQISLEEVVEVEVSEDVEVERLDCGVAIDEVAVDVLSGELLIVEEGGELSHHAHDGYDVLSRAQGEVRVEVREEGIVGELGVESDVGPYVPIIPKPRLGIGCLGLCGCECGKNGHTG